MPEVNVALFGETLTLIAGADGLTATVALAVLDVLALLVAVTVTLVAALTFGAVNKPALETVPAEAVQLTAVLVEP